MRTTIRLVVLLAATAVVGCTDGPSAPKMPNARSLSRATRGIERVTVPPASDMGDSTDGGCRSGYAVVNGRCEPVGP